MISKFDRIGIFRIISVLLTVTLILPVFSFVVNAAEDDEKTVRVGYMIYEGYQNGGEGEVKSGSAYEYYQKIRFYTDWKYEYVYGSVNEMFNMLEKGEIDIMSCVTYSEERAEKCFFSEESHGLETYFLYTHSDNKEINPGNLKTLNGKKVGVLLGSYQKIYFEEWCAQNNISCHIITYDYMEDMRTDLTNKKIDATVDIRIYGDQTNEQPWRSIYRFASEPLYFAVSKMRPDILEELNDAQAYIVSTDEYYSYEVMEKYHNGINYHNAYLNTRQTRYLDEVGTLKVGYLEGTNPLAFTDRTTNKMSGLCADYLDIMTKYYGVDFETYVYSDENIMIDDLVSGKVDIIFPLGMGYWAAEQLGVALSTSICSLPMTAIYVDIGSGETFESVAVNKYSPTQEGYVREFYPDAEIYYVENTTEALQAVKDGLADVYFVRTGSLEYMNRQFDLYSRFRTMGVSHNMEAFMATRIQDTTLSVILDKGISLLTDTQRDEARFRYTYSIDKVSLIQAIRDNKEIVVGLCLVTVLLCAVIVFVFRIMSDKEHMKMLVAERDKAAKAERAKTEFLSQMSHDIRTPMNAIIGFTNFIKEEQDVEKIKEDYVPKIEVASNHLLMLINDVLEMSRIDNGKLVFERDIHDIKGIVDSIVAVMRIQAEQKGIKLTTDISVRDRIVNCDQHHLSRVIMNLLSNAVKFTPEGGKVSITVQQKDEAPEGYACYIIKVSDTGIGMSPEFLEKVFEPFERERTSTVSGMQGTGLGMAIVKNIVDTAGDSISVESKQGEGTTFTFDVKLMLSDVMQEEIVHKQDASENHYSPEALKDFFSGRRILLVEDNEFNSTIATVILENAGFLVETAENGEIAVHKVIDAPVTNYYDVILMDVQMPIMDGYEATKSIRALDDDRSKVTIIAVTANAFESDKEKATKAGMNGHVSKPLDVDALYKTLIELAN